MRVVLRVGLGLTLVLVTASALAACAGLVGIDELQVQPVTEIDAATPADRDARDERAVDADLPEVESGPADAGSKTVFVTSTRSNGVMGGAAGADQRCNAAAARGGLDAGFVAWVSTRGANAIDRITHPGAYRLRDGRVVVKDKAQLASGNLDTPIELTETSEAVTSDRLVWTGTFPNGQTAATCDDWTSNGAIIYGTAGTLDRPKLGDWTDNGGALPASGLTAWGCQTGARLYCFER